MGTALAYFVLHFGSGDWTAVEKFQPNFAANTDLQVSTAPSARQNLVALFQRSPHGPKSLRFIAGAVLIAGSFSVYLAYPIILLYLPFSGTIKVGATAAVWILSWAVFGAGIFLTGPQGYEWFKGLWTRTTGGAGGKRTG